MDLNGVSPRSIDRPFSKSRNRRKGMIVAIETTTTTTTADPPIFNSLIGIFLINGYTTGHEASPWPVHSTDQRKDPPAIHHRFSTRRRFVPCKSSSSFSSSSCLRNDLHDHLLGPVYSYPRMEIGRNMEERNRFEYTRNTRNKVSSTVDFIILRRVRGKRRR